MHFYAAHGGGHPGAMPGVGPWQQPHPMLSYIYNKITAK